MQFGMKPTDEVGKQKVGTERDLFEIWIGNAWHTFEHMPLTISLYHLVACIFCKQAVAVEIASTTIHESHQSAVAAFSITFSGERVSEPLCLSSAKT